MGRSIVMMSILGMMLIMIHLLLPVYGFAQYSMINFLLHPSVIDGQIVFGALGTVLASVSGILIGSYLGQNWIQVILSASIAGLLFNYTMEIIGVIQWLQSQSSGAITSILCMVLSLIYFLGAWSLIEWVLGKVDA